MQFIYYLQTERRQKTIHITSQISQRRAQNLLAEQEVKTFRVKATQNCAGVVVARSCARVSRQVRRRAVVPCQIIPHPLAQIASAPGSRKIFYDSLFSTLRLAALIEWETEIWQAGEAVFLLFRKRRK